MSYMFFWGLLAGIIVVAAAAVILTRKLRRQVADLERARSIQFRRVTALEKQVTEAKLVGATSTREARLRNAREFGQYKTLLRRADAALAQARAERDAGIDDDAISQAA